MAAENASTSRPTRFEIAWIEQKANSWELTCSLRDPDVFNHKDIVLEVHEDRFTRDEMIQIHEALALLEDKFAEVFDEHDKSTHAVIERIERMRLAEEAEAEAKRRTDAIQAQNDAAAAQLEAKAAEAQALDEAIAAKRKALAAVAPQVVVTDKE